MDEQINDAPGQPQCNTQGPTKQPSNQIGLLNNVSREAPRKRTINSINLSKKAINLSKCVLTLGRNLGKLGPKLVALCYGLGKLGPKFVERTRVLIALCCGIAKLYLGRVFPLM